MAFDVDIGLAQQRGPRERQEDCAAVHTAPHDVGLVAAIADGVSSAGMGREAAQTAVCAVLSDFPATPPTWDTTTALDRVIRAHNAWLADHNRRRQGQRDENGAAIGTSLTTLTALALRGHGYTVAHVGDTRAWLMRPGSGSSPITQLTVDHSLEHPDLSSGLTRALGLDDDVRLDYLQGELQVGDLFALTSDGVHGVIKPARLQAALERVPSEGAQAVADELTQTAIDAGSRDNASVVILHIRGLTAARLEDSLRVGRQLAPPAKLRAGDVLDGLTIEALVHDNGIHRLYRARAADGSVLALKALHEARANDPQEREMLAHEAWLALQVAGDRDTAGQSAGFVRGIEPREPSAFYTLSEWHDGQTLEQLLASKRRFSVTEAVNGACTVARALGRLHRLGVIHRDVKPENLHLGSDGQWRLLDLGVALSGAEPAALRELHAGTPSYMNPEQWGDDPDTNQPDARSDLFALGVTLYRWLTGHLPYGEVVPYQSGRYRRDPVPPSRLRPEVPIWLDHLVLKAVALDRRQRFETAEEMLLALERGASRPLQAPPATPLLSRDPTALWKLALGVSLLFNLLLAYWLIFLPK